MRPGSRRKSQRSPRSTRTSRPDARGTREELGGAEPPGARRESHSNEAASLRAQALRLLARREHSRQELARKLAPANPNAVAALLDELQARGWLSEQRLAEQLLHAAAGRFGARKVMQQLAQKGVSHEVAELARSRALQNELESARAAWLKRFGKTAASLRERARQTRFLAQRGFAPEVIHKVLGGEFEE